MLEISILLALIHGETGVLEAVQQGYGVSPVDIAGSGAAGNEIVGSTSKECNLASSIERKDALVLQQHHTFERALASHGCVSRKVRIIAEGISLGLGAAGHQFKASADAYVQLGLSERAVLDCGHYLLVLQVRTWLEHIVAGRNLRGAIVTAVPVGHHGALEAPFITKDGGYQVITLGSVGAVYLVIGGHNRPGLSFLDSDLESLQVYLALRALTDHGIVACSVCLLVVICEMLYCRSHVVFLDATHVCGGRLAGNHRIFRIILKITAVKWMAMDVQRRGQIHIGTVFVHFLSHCSTNLLYKFLVPGGSEQGTDREVRTIVGVGVPFTDWL